MNKIIFFLLSFMQFNNLLALGGSCDELGIGESKRVAIPGELSSTHVEHKYTLKHTSEKLWDVYINYDLNPKIIRKLFNPLYKSEKEKINIRYKEYIQSCFDRHNFRLKDGLGRAIRLNVYDSSKHKDIDTPPAVDIKIVSTSRSDSRHYDQNVGCSTIVHESFHLLGLPDEYEERWMAWNPHFGQRLFKPFVSSREVGAEDAFDCRSIGSDISIMGNNEHYLSNYRRIIHSGQLNVILFPNCKKKNNLYYQCSKNAYRTSKDHGGLFGCHKVPKECSNDEWYGI